MSTASKTYLYILIESFESFELKISQVNKDNKTKK